MTTISHKQTTFSMRMTASEKTILEIISKMKGKIMMRRENRNLFEGEAEAGETEHEAKEEEAGAETLEREKGLNESIRTETSLNFTKTTNSFTNGSCSLKKVPLSSD